MKTHVGLIAKTDCNSCQTQFRLNMDMHKNTSFLEISVFLIGIAQQTWGYQAEMLISARSPLISAIIIKTPRYDTLGNDPLDCGYVFYCHMVKPGGNMM